MAEKFYTAGEIWRRKMLRSHFGKPYTEKSTVARIVRSLPHKKVPTPHGMGYAVSLSTIRAYNARWRKK